MWLVCDCGYGFPNEVRPRQEKLNAICRQVVNFLQWQHERCHDAAAAEDAAAAAAAASVSPERRTLVPARLLLVLGTDAGVATTGGSSTKRHSRSSSNTNSVTTAAPESATSYRGGVNGDARLTCDLGRLLLERMKQVWRHESNSSFPEGIVFLTTEELRDAIRRLQSDCAVATKEGNTESGEPLTGICSVVEPSHSIDSNAACDSTAPTTLDDTPAATNTSECADAVVEATNSAVAVATTTSTTVSTTTATATGDRVNGHDETNGGADMDSTLAPPPPPASEATVPATPAASVVYLSPDATRVLDAHSAPPAIAIVGMLIDRRTIQVNRSMRRAEAVVIPTARWPLEHCVLAGTTAVTSTTTGTTSGTSGRSDNKQATPTSTETLPPVIHINEPLNVDCILEGMQQWDWNYHHQQQQQQQQSVQKTYPGTTTTTAPEWYRNDTDSVSSPSHAPLINAIQQALRHHQQRHPERVLHKKAAAAAALDDDPKHLPTEAAPLDVASVQQRMSRTSVSSSSSS